MVFACHAQGRSEKHQVPEDHGNEAVHVSLDREMKVTTVHQRQMGSVDCQPYVAVATLFAVALTARETQSPECRPEDLAAKIPPLRLAPPMQPIFECPAGVLKAYGSRSSWNKHHPSVSACAHTGLWDGFAAE